MNYMCYGEMKGEILADFFCSLSLGVKTTELLIGKVATLQVIRQMY